MQSVHHAQWQTMGGKVNGLGNHFFEEEQNRLVERGERVGETPLKDLPAKSGGQALT